MCSSICGSALSRGGAHRWRGVDGFNSPLLFSVHPLPPVRTTSVHCHRVCPLCHLTCVALFVVCCVVLCAHSGVLYHFSPLGNSLASAHQHLRLCVFGSLHPSSASVSVSSWQSRPSSGALQYRPVQLFSFLMNCMLI